jgi:hypothetical protein
MEAFTCKGYRKNSRHSREGGIHVDLKIDGLPPSRE